MGNGQVSVGDDTPTGEPENGPRGPYITDKDDGTANRDGPRRQQRPATAPDNGRCRPAPRPRSRKRANSAATDKAAGAVEARRKKAKLPSFI